MTTQATQSPNALGRRTSPSSFFAPLQTLGLNLDRKKNSSRPSDGSNAYVAPAGQESQAGGRDTRDDRDDRDIRDNRDIRDIGTASPEAGRPLMNAGRTAAAFGMKDDLLFPAAAQRRDARQDAFRALDREPDPELVRGAISRLAREYALPETDSEAPLPPASVGPEPSHDLRSQPLAFAEVARRVWAEAESEHLAAYQPASQPLSRSASQTAPDARGAERESAELADAELEGAELENNGPPSHAAATEYMPDLSPDSRLEPRLNSRLNSRLGPASGLDEARALAHDAGNLLSALRLYGDLLCFSGVLHERHRHYAIDLKLLSLRSESLIGRLLTLAEQVAQAGRSAPASAQAESPIPLRAAAYGTADRLAPRVVPSRPANSTSGSTSGFMSSFAPGPSQGYAPNLDSGPGLEAGGRTEEESVETDETSSLADILLRMRGLLGTIAHGALELDAGDQGGLEVAAPAEVVERILVNLVSNAAAAVRSGGAIRVRAGIGTGFGTASATPVVVLTVDDSGCGMSEAQIRGALSLNTDSDSDRSRDGDADGDEGQRQASQPGHSRGELSQNPSPGGPDRQHGLGLLIVRDLVASTGGRLFIHSRQGTGTRMEIQWHAAKVPSLANQHRAEIEQIGNGDARNVEFRGEVRRDDSGWEAPDFSSSVARPEIWPGVGSRFIPTGAAGLHRAGLKVENLRAESLRAEDLKPENRAAFTNGAKGAVA